MERRSADSERVCNNPDCPQIDLFVVTLTLVEDLWSQIVRSAAHGGPSLDVHVLATDKQSGQAKVTHLDVHVVVEEEIPGFEIPMDNIPRVEVLDGTADLDHESTDLGHGETFSLFEQVGKRATRAELENDIGVVDEGECAVEADDIGVAKFRVYLELRNKL